MYRDKNYILARAKSEALVYIYNLNQTVNSQSTSQFILEIDMTFRRKRGLGDFREKNNLQTVEE